jgi:predicted nucleic acid-binding protein
VKVALDTNVLAYAEGVNALDRRRLALELLGRLPTAAALVPVQTLGEPYNGRDNVPAPPVAEG